MSGGCADSINKETKPARVDLCGIWQNEFAPKSVDIIGLSGISKNGEKAVLKAYVVLLDQAGSSVKSPVTMRVELYERSGRSPVPKGKRLKLWPDIDLTSAGENNQYWRDYLRAYEFSFDVGVLAHDKSYLVEVTAELAGARRTTAIKEITYAK